MMKNTIVVCAVLMILVLGISANAETVFNVEGGDFKDAVNWTNGLPGDTDPVGTINVSGDDGEGSSQNHPWMSGGTVTVDNGAVLTWGTDLSVDGGTLIVNNATMNCNDDLFVQNGVLILNAGSVTTAVDDWECNNLEGRIIVNGGTHSSAAGTGGNVGAQGGAKIGCGVDFLGGTVTAGNFRFQVNSVSSVGGSAVLDSAGASTTFSDATGAIDIIPGWTGSWTVGSFSGTNWKDLVTNAGNGFTLDGAAIDAASFDENFIVSPDGKTLTYVNSTASSSDPSNAETLVEADLSGRTVAGELSWGAPQAYTGATYDVYFGTNEPNFAEPDYDLTKLTVTPQSGTSIAPTAFLPLGDEVTYYWVVDAYEPNTVPVLHQGATWSFTSIPLYLPPSIASFDNMITTLDIGDTTVSGLINLGSEATTTTMVLLDTDYQYPGGASFVDNTTDPAAPTGQLTVTLPGTYKIKLTADDGTTVVEQIAEVVVYDDACQAKKDSPSSWTANYYDRDGNCLVDLSDFAVMAQNWLDSTVMIVAETYEGPVHFLEVDVAVECENAYMSSDPNYITEAPLTMVADTEVGGPHIGDIAAASNGQFIGWTDPNDFITLEVEIPETGDYTVILRNACPSGDALTAALGTVSPDGDPSNDDITAYGTIALSDGLGFTEYKTDSAIMNFTAGTHYIRLTWMGGPFNVDLLAFKKVE